MKRFFLPLLFAVLLATAASALSDEQGGPAENTADRFLGPDRDGSFNAYVEFIESVHSVSVAGMNRIGVSWEQALENGRRRFREARTVDDVYYALLSVQRSLRDGHGRFEKNELPVAFGRAVKLDFEVVVRYAHPTGGRHEYVVSHSNEPALPAGSTILGYAGRSIADFETEMLEWYDRHTPEGFREFVARRFSACKPKAMPCPQPGDEVAIAYRDRDGVERVGTLTWRAGESGRKSDQDSAASADSTRQAAKEPVEPEPPLQFDDQYRGFPRECAGIFFAIHGTQAADTKILRYFSFNYENETDFRKEIAVIGDHLAKSGATRVLVDVRENRGGAFEPGLIGVFTSQPFRIMMKSFYYGARIKADPEAMTRDKRLELWTESETRILRQDLAANPTASWSRLIPFFCQSEACWESEAVFRFDGSPGYEAVVLAGPSTFSSGDMFVSLMKGNGLARLAGMPSGAGDAPYRWFLDYPLADGTKVSLRLTTAVSYHPGADGLTIEGNPPPLDLPLYPTRANAEALLDSVLTAAGWEPARR